MEVVMCLEAQHGEWIFFLNLKEMMEEDSGGAMWKE